MTLIAGDIGGTKTILALYPPDGDPRHPQRQETFRSADYPDLEAMLREFLQGMEHPALAGVFGVAGPVVHDQARVTNLSWVVDREALKKAFGLKHVALMNDIVAVANAVPILGEEDVYVLNQEEVVPGGAVAVIAPGTGLGEAYLTWDGQRYRAYASEGGHTDFGPKTRVEVRLLGYLQEKFEHVSYERVCSGSGIPNLYTFFKDSGRYAETPWLAERLAVVDDPVPLIVNTALAGDPPCAICDATLDLFISILGAEAGNMALKVLATGGVYLGGGIPPRILPRLKGGGFMQAFVRKGRFAALLSAMRVCVILNDHAALIGAANFGLQEISGREGQHAD